MISYIIFPLQMFIINHKLQQIYTFFEGETYVKAQHTFIAELIIMITIYYKLFINMVSFIQSHNLFTMYINKITEFERRKKLSNKSSQFQYKKEKLITYFPSPAFSSKRFFEVYI